MGARRRIATSVRATRIVGRIAAGALLSGAAVAVTLDLSGPAGADTSGATHGTTSVITSAPTTVPTTVPPTTVPPAPVPPAPVAAPAASSQTSGPQPQPAIGAPAGTNPWDDPNAG